MLSPRVWELRCNNRSCCAGSHRIVQEGVASAEEINKAMKLGAGMPMGPLALVDWLE